VAERLDRQRPPSKTHKRFNGRTYQRGYTTLPHNVWGTALTV
jgi:hypothetical protein